MTRNVGKINLIRRMHTIHVVEQGWPPGKVKDPSNIKESHYLLSFVEEGFIEVEISHRFFASSYIQDNSKTSSTGAVPLLPAMFGLGSQQLAGSLVHWKVLSEQRCLFTLWSSIQSEYFLCFLQMKMRNFSIGNLILPTAILVCTASTARCAIQWLD